MALAIQVCNWSTSFLLSWCVCLMKTCLLLRWRQQSWLWQFRWYKSFTTCIIGIHFWATFTWNPWNPWNHSRSYKLLVLNELDAAHELDPDHSKHQHKPGLACSIPVKPMPHGPRSLQLHPRKCPCLSETLDSNQVLIHPIFHLKLDDECMSPAFQAWMIKHLGESEPPHCSQGCGRTWHVKSSSKSHWLQQRAFLDGIL